MKATPNWFDCRPTGLLAALLGAASVGCIHTERTVYHEEPRAKVEFENDTAGRLFYEALSRRHASRPKAESSTEVSLPIVFSHKEKRVQGDAVAFNDAVRRCDTNGDGRITEQEARIFSEQVKSP